jgi:meso-butanediol dehydrogenase / (S,S)-butanediol dehydrogenase / diacetyl reductase
VKRLAGKVALVTGTAGGIGRAAAELFAAEGAVVVGCDLQPTEEFDTVDLGDEAAVQEWVDRQDRIDVLYNNAGTTRFAPLEEESYEEHWRFTMHNQLDLGFIVTKAAWPHLRASGNASVINTASTAALTGSLDLHGVAHRAAKGAIVAMTRQFAMEGAHYGIRVNSISPGVVLSPATSEMIFGDPEHPLYNVRERIPLGRVATPEDVARLALFLASDESTYITAANIVIDGGWSVAAR